MSSTDSKTFTKQAAQFAKLLDNGQGRNIEDLKKSKDILKGQEANRLRLYCTVSNRMEPNRDLDTFGNLLMRGNLESVITNYSGRVHRLVDNGLEFEAAHKGVASDLYGLRWGPTEVPIYNLLGLFSQIFPDHRLKYHAFTEFFIEAKVPVDGKDLSGTTALSHCFSTKPSFDLEYAQILHNAGGDVNSRNRFGATVAHEIVMVYGNEPEVLRRATAALEWFLTHGGSVDIADGDGMAARALVSRFPPLSAVVQKEDARRKAAGPSCCSLCGRDEEKLLSCSRCKIAKYCSPAVRACQKLDWPRHKKLCKC